MCVCGFGVRVCASEYIDKVIRETKQRERERVGTEPRH